MGVQELRAGRSDAGRDARNRRTFEQDVDTFEDGIGGIARDHCSRVADSRSLPARCESVWNKENRFTWWTDVAWFRHDRFGMFIHWGAYARAGRGEWVRSRERISNILLFPGYEVLDAHGPAEIVSKVDETYHHGLITSIRQAAEKASYVLTVCTGTALLAKTGLLDGRRATLAGSSMARTI